MSDKEKIDKWLEEHDGDDYCEYCIYGNKCEGLTYDSLGPVDMVRAILSGSKTVARRLVKPQPWKSMIYKLGYCVDGDKEDIGKYGFGSLECSGHVRYVKPPCQPGDILYVRETWNTKCKHCESECTAPCSAPYYVYKSDYPYTEDKWRPSIHMPKEAARIWLKVVDIQPERLHDIDDNGVKAEGFETGCYFDDIWNSAVKKTDISRYGWNANPWVWVIEFERCDKPEKWPEEGCSKDGGKWD